MGPNAPGDQQRAPQPDTFWRRRVIALALGIAVVGLLAWAVSGVLGGGTSAKQADAGQATKTGAAVASTPTMPAIAAASASASGSAQPSGATHPATPTPTATPTPSRKTVTTAHTGDGCPTGDVVISLTASGDSFISPARPEFDIAVVSTDARTCGFGVGVKSLRLVIKSGPARVWGSADCLAGAGSKAAQLTRGVPAVLHISWDRKTSLPGCKLAGTVALPGTYTAAAYSGQVTSNTIVFVLRATSVAGP